MHGHGASRRRRRAPASAPPPPQSGVADFGLSSASGLLVLLFQEI
jgi:hypothetical protein